MALSGVLVLRLHSLTMSRGREVIFFGGESNCLEIFKGGFNFCEPIKEGS